MRKVRPADVRAGFDSFCEERLQHFQRIRDALRDTQNEKRDVSIVCETTFHAIYVAFECFVSDLLLAYINRDCSTYQQDLKARIESSVETKFGVWAKQRAPFVPVKHIAVRDLEAILDPDGWNLTFKSTESMVQYFTRCVATPHRDAVVNLTTSDRNLIDASRAMRNYIAHRSDGSRTILNRQLSAIAVGAGCPNAPLQRGAREKQDVGSYLKTSVGGTTRTQLYAQRLRAIAAAM